MTSTIGNALRTDGWAWYSRALRVPAPGRTVADGQPIKVDGYAFDMLMALIEAPRRAPTGGLSKSIE
ncbi:MAG TPA: hypothetical protein VE621_06700 [Bryobacteraceae bacterium]|nr:hypothetical protein [Bryobacteraceae bacterium]